MWLCSCYRLVSNNHNFVRPERGLLHGCTEHVFKYLPCLVVRMENIYIILCHFNLTGPRLPWRPLDTGFPTMPHSSSIHFLGSVRAFSWALWGLIALRPPHGRRAGVGHLCFALQVLFTDRPIVPELGLRLG